MVRKNHKPAEIKNRLGPLAKYLVNPDDSRIRSGWRLLLHSVLFNILLISGAVIVVLPVMLSEILTIDILLGQLVSLAAVTLSVFLAKRFLDHKPFRSIGLTINKRTGVDLSVGFLIAGMVLLLVYLAEYHASWLHFESYAWDQPESYQNIHVLNLRITLPPALTVSLSSVLWLLFFCIVSWSEELLFRGYRLQVIAEGLGMPLGILLSSIWFGLAHGLNPGASWISSLGIIFAGLFLAYSYALTKQLWLPLGLHLGWNFFEGVVFGFPVSGLESYKLIQHTLTGPELWTGGSFGPEAGLILIPALLFGTMLVYGYTRVYPPLTDILPEDR